MTLLTPRQPFLATTETDPYLRSSCPELPCHRRQQTSQAALLDGMQIMSSKATFTGQGDLTRRRFARAWQLRKAGPDHRSYFQSYIVAHRVQ